MLSITPVSGPKADEFWDPLVTHYENGPLTIRMVEREGKLWSVSFRAEHDGTGWRVVSAHVLLEEDRAIRPGDLVDIRCKVAEDHGAELHFVVEAPGVRQMFWAKRSAISSIVRAEP